MRIPRLSGHSFHEHPDTFRQEATQDFSLHIDLFFRSKDVVVERLSMRKIREVLAKFDAGLSVRKIAQSLCIGIKEPEIAPV
jgi:hypothetical protein